ncbi:lipopolysaccharide biosynthesis protein [Kitasatospora sp. NBC_01539]|uniref:lipopolysaccharide biosynthesis protein n=1 Tax=Kitasatospora sp. NBC_01539 TaxID=2903577 RepID=UPI00386013BC
MKRLRSLATALPAGLRTVAVGTAVLGVASYLQLAVAGHSLTTEAMAGVSVLWTIVMSVGIGLFLPLEQELTRIVAARTVRGEGARPVLRRATLLTCGILGVILTLMAVFARPLADLLLHGDTALVAALGSAFAAMAFCYLTRGILAGLGRFTPYGTQLAVDGALRMLLAFGCAAAGLHSALAFSLIMTVAPLLALLATLPATVRAVRPGPPQPWSGLVRGLGPLMGSTLLAQWMVSAAVMSVQLLEPDQVDLVAALLSALVLARVPIFVFGALQASLLSGLAGAAAAGRHADFLAMLRRACAAVTLLCVAISVPAVVLGPWLIHLLFAAPEVLDRADFLCLCLGAFGYLLAMVLGQALIVLHRHRAQLVCWLLGTAVLVGVTLVPGPIEGRVCVAFAAGPLACAAGMLWSLRGAVPRRPSASAPAGAEAEPIPSA